MATLALIYSWLPAPLYVLVMAAISLFGLILLAKIVVFILDLIPIF